MSNRTRTMLRMNNLQDEYLSMKEEEEVHDLLKEGYEILYKEGLTTDNETLEVIGVDTDKNGKILCVGYVVMGDSVCFHTTE